MRLGKYAYISNIVVISSSVSKVQMDDAHHRLHSPLPARYLQRGKYLASHQAWYVTNHEYAAKTTERRLPPKKGLGPAINLRAFKSPAYSFYCAAAFMNFLGLYTVLTYINISAEGTKVPANLTFYLLPIANAGSMFGRICGGFLADKYGGHSFCGSISRRRCN